MTELERLRAEVEALKLIVAASLHALQDPFRSALLQHVEAMRSKVADRLLFSTKLTDEQLAHLDAVVRVVASPTSDQR